MRYFVYIIGETPQRINLSCQIKFKKAQILLEEKGFRVFNPIITLVNKKIKFEDANKINVRQLLNCNVAYVLNSVSLEKTNNAELLLALKLNMLIIQDSIFLNEET